MVRNLNTRELDVNRKPVFVILLSTLLISLYFAPSLEDPFNSPKLWILVMTGCWVIGYLFTVKLNKNETNYSKTTRNLILILLGLILAILFSTLFTSVKYTAFFGEAQRRTGLLAYFFFAIFMAASAKYFKAISIKKLLNTNIFLATTIVVYGQIQHTGNDFVSWNNPYNAIIGTLGNPNFASALMAISAALCITSIFFDGYNRSFKIYNALLALFLLYTIYLSNSRQGLVAFSLASAFLLSIICQMKSRILGLFSFVISVILGLFAVLGMLQVGPFKYFLYKDSVSIRGFYWRSGLQMFLDHPWTGVGIDRYGAFFKQYREVQYPLKYGFDITSTNAHSVPIQLFATGGIFVGLFYLLLAGFIFYRGIKSLKLYLGREKIVVAGIFSSWLAYQAQSIISIDNIGLTIWGWVLGGAVVGLSTKVEVKVGTNQVLKKSSTNLQSITLAQPVISGGLTLLAVILVSILYRGETITMQTKMYYNASSQNQKVEFYNFIGKSFDTPLIDPYYKLKMVDLLATTDKQSVAVSELDKLLKSDPRNQDILNIQANIAERLPDFEKAINFRESLAKYDPWNAINYLNLGRDYRAIGDYENMNRMRDKILSFASNTDAAKTAIIELVQ